MKQDQTVDNQKFDDPDKAVDALCAIYDRSVQQLREQYQAFRVSQQNNVEVPCYPELRVRIPADRSFETSNLSLGQVASSNVHATSVTNPELFRGYFTEELTRITSELGASISVGLSDEPIPLQFALDPYHTQEDQGREAERYFPSPNLVELNDEIIDGRTILRRDRPLPLSWFRAGRVDYSLFRLQHYTATDPKHFQRFVLFTNYQRYVDEFLQYAQEEIERGDAIALVEPGNRVTLQGEAPNKAALAQLPQMPAYHLVRPDNMGDTLINIGVGPSNAKTITDHMAVLRPHSWLMIGHCGGLRRTQSLGDYVLAHAYLRDDHVLDRMLPADIPLPTLAEVQLALTRAVQEVTGCTESELKNYLRTGTVVTTGDRNWELLFEDNAERLNQSRAIAIDMESATIAANGFRFRVPYGTLLCVSDKPLHGELKLPGMANDFYRQRIGQHLLIALNANNILREEARAGTLRSRKLRSFDDPLFY